MVWRRGGKAEAVFVGLLNCNELGRRAGVQKLYGDTLNEPISRLTRCKLISTMTKAECIMVRELMGCNGDRKSHADWLMGRIAASGRQTSVSASETRDGVAG